MFKGNRDRLLSMAYDDVGSTGLSFDEWYDNEITEGRKQPVDWRAPQNEDLLRKELTDYYAGVISNGVGTAVGNYNARKNPAPLIHASVKLIKINPYREEFHKKLFFSQEGQELPAMTFRIDYNQSVHVKPTEELIIKDEIIRKEGA